MFMPFAITQSMMFHFMTLVQDDKVVFVFVGDVNGF